MRDFVSLSFGGGMTPIQVRFGLERWSRYLGDLGPCFRDTIPVLESHMEKMFAREGAQNKGGKWAPLSPTYALQKAHLFPGRPILTRTGTMRSGLASSSPGSIRAWGKDSLLFGVASKYARYHQEGTRKMPARKPFDFEHQIQRKGSVGWAIGQVFQAHVVEFRAKAFNAADPSKRRRVISPAKTVIRLQGMDLF